MVEKLEQSVSGPCPWLEGGYLPHQEYGHAWPSHLERVQHYSRDVETKWLFSQYKFLNSSMSLEQFKIIFYWEYIHRIFARALGLFFLIFLIYFHFSKKIKKTYLFTCYFIFTLIVLQGFIGWYMVQSGLVNDITVSHFRLSFHLSTAIVIISIIFWLLRNIISNNDKKFFKLSSNNFIFQMLLLIIFLQIILGAFVSGLDAGQIYQTWPQMGNSFIPDDIILDNLKSTLDFNSHSLVQFYHRILAYVIILYVLCLTIYIYKKKITYLYVPLNILILFLSFQVILGIFTLISGLNIYLASMHQIISVLLVLSALNLYYLRTK